MTPNKQTDKPYIVDFGEGEERWQDAELGKKWSTWIETEKKGDAERKKTIPNYQGLSDRFYSERASTSYKTDLIHKYLEEHPYTNIFEPESDEAIQTNDSLIRNHFNLSPKDDITSTHRNYAIAWRLARGLNYEDEPFVSNIDKLYNRQVIEEDKAWEAAKVNAPKTEPTPEYKPTSPSRLQSLGVFGQNIDPNVPMFLQKANPHIPWGINHPLKKLYRKHALTRRATEEREEYEYDAMEKLNNPRYLEEGLYPQEDIEGEPWFHHEETAKEVKKWGYTPHLIDKMQTFRQQSLLDLYKKHSLNDE
jgi:hypothetical protein